MTVLDKSNKKGMYILISICIIVFAYLIASWTILPHQATVEYPGDGTYTGEFRGKLFEGQGTFTSVNGCVYTGEFKDGQFHGQGTMTFINGSKYKGAWNNGQMNGKGTLIQSDGSKISGIWEKGKLKKTFD